MGKKTIVVYGDGCLWNDEAALEKGLCKAGYDVRLVNDPNQAQFLLGEEAPFAVIFYENVLRDHYWAYSGEFLALLKKRQIHSIMVVNRPCFMPKLQELRRQCKVDAVVARPIMPLDVLERLKGFSV